MDLERDTRQKEIAYYKNKASQDQTGFVAYSDEPLKALDALSNLLQPGDVFLTLGAGDNWKLGKALAEKIEKNG